MLRGFMIVVGYFVKGSILASAAILGILYCQWGSELNTQLMTQLLETYSK